MEPIAHIRTDFGSKFGIPRQSGLVSELLGCLVFEPAYRIADAFRGLEGFSHLWLLWDFSESHRKDWSPTVRPPRLGGNVRMGVFATRSTFRPNPIGLSCVEIDRIEIDAPDGPLIWVRGADLMDRTPIFDIKPYLPFTDSRPEAKCGFAEYTMQAQPLDVVVDKEVEKLFPKDKMIALQKVLSQDPRPRYQNDVNRLYGFEFCGQNIHFRAENNKIWVFL